MDIVFAGRFAKRFCGRDNAVTDPARYCINVLLLTGFFDISVLIDESMPGLYRNLEWQVNIEVMHTSAEEHTVARMLTACNRKRSIRLKYLHLRRRESYINTLSDYFVFPRPAGYD